MKTKNVYAASALFFAATTLLMSCKKDVSQNTNTITVDASKTLTNYDSTVNFANYRTVAIAPNVQVLNGSSLQPELTPEETQYIKAFGDSLVSRGFTLVDISASPDLVLNITRINNTSTGLVDNAGYWSNYGTYYNPSEFNETGATYVTNFTTSQPVDQGTVLSLELLDLKSEPASGQIDIVWNALVGGYLQLNGSAAVAPETAVIFSKSPYLKKQ